MEQGRQGREPIVRAQEIDLEKKTAARVSRCAAEIFASVTRRLFLHVLGEEVGGALPRHAGAVLVEAAALVAMEAVAGLAVDEDFANRTNAFA